MAYKTIDSGSAEKCGCQFCRNFVAQRKLIYPQQFRELLDRFGIDAEKEGDVYEGMPSGALVVYRGWFYLAGEIIEAGERLNDSGSGFEYFFRTSYRPIALADFGEEVLLWSSQRNCLGFLVNHQNGDWRKISILLFYHREKHFPLG